ncbi:glycoside hydrolase [Aspergillus sclerotioniger CBS 115572]|uniref:Probable glucan endo-1,3-beta-glucosidase eglC n=1 Tax=Aspergillus sclerotioniger CBS 115572 TaxID=1450535 RepID=A0A317V110_9EURO|nr:glycoside hydrolase [Aspergillus sclerotioniger CBS 115572]PWY68014.1 glycoside hydrolase [Aspergillus sclerotioniger CBS 115572]
MLSKMQLAQLAAFAMSLATAEAAYQGFNYGNKNSDESSKFQADFEAEFKVAKNLVGTSGFTSARLYTMIQAYSTSDVIEAIPAAIAQDTSLLLGLWASGGGMDNELTALKSAISTYGEELGKLVVGISVGSEDLYRNSVEGVEADAGVGVNPDELVTYIKEVREAIAGTALSGAPIGHVDTWDSWTNSSNSGVVDAVDWLGFDGYPFFQSSMSNSIDDAKALFQESVEKTKSVAGDKEVWITETGWPVSGDSEGEAIASIANAKIYWDEVGCPLFGNTNTWWYILQDAAPTTPNPSFGIVGSNLTTTPLFDLSCNTTSSSSSAAASSATGSSTGSAGSVSGNKGTGSLTSAGSAGAGGAAKPTFTVGRPGGVNGTAYGNGTYPARPSGSASARPSGGVISGSGSGSGSSGSGSSATSGQSASGSSAAAAAASSGLYTGSASSLSGSTFGAVVAVFLALAAL